MAAAARHRQRPSRLGAAAARALLAYCATAHGFSLLQNNKISSTNPNSLLGNARRWPAPTEVGDSAGLGGGISFAYDPQFCEQMLPRFAAESAIDPLGLTEELRCAQLYAAMDNAMDTWANNHPAVKFTRDFSKCAGEAECASTELFISVFDAAAVGGTPSGSAAELRLGFTLVREASTQDTPMLLRNASGAQRLVGGSSLERVALRFNQTQCWYLDSEFCAPLNLGRAEGSPLTSGLALVVAVFVLWCGATVYLALSAVRAVWLCGAGRTGRRAASAAACAPLLLAPPALDELADPADHAPAHPAEHAPALSAPEHALLVVASVRPWRTALALFVLTSSLLMWQLVLLPCTTCYDFELVAAHEIGHVLGIGHPTSSPYLLVAQPEAESREDLACGRRLLDALEVGVAPGGSEEAEVDVGQTVMDARSQFPRETCVGQDDLDALNSLYPACEDGTNRGPPLCARSRRSLGATRLLSVLLLPLVCAVGLVFSGVAAARRRAAAVVARVRSAGRGEDERADGPAGHAAHMPASSFAGARAHVLRSNSSLSRGLGGSSGELSAQARHVARPPVVQPGSRARGGGGGGGGAEELSAKARHVARPPVVQPGSRMRMPSFAPSAKPGAGSAAPAVGARV